MAKGDITPEEVRSHPTHPPAKSGSSWWIWALALFGIAGVGLWVYENHKGQSASITTGTTGSSTNTTPAVFLPGFVGNGNQPLGALSYGTTPANYLSLPQGSLVGTEGVSGVAVDPGATNALSAYDPSAGTFQQSAVQSPGYQAGTLGSYQQGSTTYLNQPTANSPSRFHGTAIAYNPNSSSGSTVTSLGSQPRVSGGFAG